jgi:hypothetical protein
MMRSLLLAGIVVMCCAGSAMALVGPDTLWTRTYGGNGRAVALDLKPTRDGGFVMCGEANVSPVADEADILVIKTDGVGTEQWKRVMGGPGLDYTWQVVETHDGQFMLVGRYDGQFCVLKLASNGDSLWLRTYGAGEGIGIIETSDHHYVAIGCVPDNGWDWLIVKINSAGDSLWRRQYGGSGQDQGNVVRETADGGLVAGGPTSSFGHGSFDGEMMRLEQDGTKTWDSCYGGSGLDWIYDLQITGDGGIIAVGGYNATPPHWSNGDLLIVRADSTGNTLWTRNYAGPYSVVGRLVATEDGGYVIPGDTRSEESGQDFLLWKISAVGDTLWTRNYGIPNLDCALSCCLTEEGGYLLAGTRGYADNSRDVYLVKTSPDPCFHQPPLVPQVAISIVGADARLNWNRVTESVNGCPVNVTGYEVFYSPTAGGPFYYHGFTSDTSYTHVRAVQFASGMYYQVVAYTGALAALQSVQQGEEMEAVIRKTGK